MTLELAGTAAIIGVCLYLLRSALRLFYIAYRMSRGTFIVGHRRLPDAPAPEELSEIDTVIRALGFVPDRLIEYRLVGVKVPYPVWAYSRDDLHIGLALSPEPAEPPFGLAMETHFADGAALVTYYPRGTPVETPQYVAGFAQHSLQDAFDHHLLKQFELAETHGGPVAPPADDAGYFAIGDAVQKRHARVLYGAAINRCTGSGVAMLGYILLFIFLTLQVMPQILPGLRRLPDSLLLLLVGSVLLVGGNGYAGRGKTPKPVDAGAEPPVDPSVHPLNRPPRTV